MYCSYPKDTDKYMILQRSENTHTHRHTQSCLSSLTAQFTTESLEARRVRRDIYSVEGTGWSSLTHKLSYPAKLSSENKREVQTFSDEQKLH